MKSPKTNGGPKPEGIPSVPSDKKVRTLSERHRIDPSSLPDQAEGYVYPDASCKQDDSLEVLIIDDDIDTTWIFKAALREAGFSCQEATSPKEALYKLATSEPDMVLLDLRLGREINGEDILLQIRTNPRLDETNVMVLTAYPEMVDTITDLVDLVLIKPVDVVQLKSLVKRLGGYRRKFSNIHLTDPATGLYNQHFFYTRLEHAIERAKRHPDFLFATSVLGFDLFEGDRHVKNDYAKSILRQAARRLQTKLRPTDTIACLLGRSFATLHEELRQPQDIQVIINRIQKTLAPPYGVNDKTYRLEISLGAVIHDRRYKMPQEILDRSEKAMELARRTGGCKHLIVPSYNMAPIEQFV